MESALALLRQEGLLADWSDRRILPGQHISPKVESKLEEADIICFLLSHHFIASSECMKEWNRAKALSRNGTNAVRVPIILSDCAWKQLLARDDIKALPEDGKPVVSYDEPSTAWHQVYEGLAEVIEQRRRTFSPRPDLLKAMEATDLISQDHVLLSDIFIFPNLVQFRPDSARTLLFEDKIHDIQQLLSLGRCIIHGEEMSGKSSLAKHILLTLAAQNKPVMFIDLFEENKRPSEEVLRSTYRSQFSGDFNLWISQPSKTIVFDNLTHFPRSIEYVQLANEIFENIIVTTSTDVFRSYYRGDDRLVTFKEVLLRPLSHVQQEELIRRRLTLMDSVDALTDGLVDDVERRVNLAFAHNIVPRYPFYILAVIQTLEGFMPTRLSVTSYGHCYYVMVLARLTKCGISQRDEDINASVNFAEHLALEIYERSLGSAKEEVDLDAFVERYTQSFLFPKRLLNRLADKEYGLISNRGAFRVEYMYHYFLGMYLSKSTNARRTEVVEHLCEHSHVSSNHLTLMFTIHHSTDDEILEKILSKTMGTLVRIEPARLDVAETERFGDIVESLPATVLSDDSVESKRREERERRDVVEAEGSKSPEDTGIEMVNDWYRILKNNKILGQVLRNRYGSLERGRVRELIQVVADGGLRLVNSLLRDENEIAELASFLAESRHISSIEEARTVVHMFSFLWTMAHVEQIVGNVSFREVREVVEEVVVENESPAYDLIGYFSAIVSAEKLTLEISQKLKDLLGKHRDSFIRSVLSITTQQYMNTHRSPANVEQTICSMLGIPYRQRLMEARRRDR